jgi:hypothetical protein
METSKESEAHVFLDRTTRPTRGKRMTKLLDEEVEEDELFWNQEALKEVNAPSSWRLSSFGYISFLFGFVVVLFNVENCHIFSVFSLNFP